MTQQLQETWDAFLREWPIERLRKMTLREYSAAGDGNTFTAWIESRLDQIGSIWGGSSFKFGIYSRRDKSAKVSSRCSWCRAWSGWATAINSTSQSSWPR